MRSRIVREETNRIPEIDNEVELTLHKAIEQIAEVAYQSKLNSATLDIAARPIAYISERFGISEMQSILLVAMVSMYYDRQTDMTDIARWLNITTIMAIPLLNDIDHLCHLRYVQCRMVKGVKVFWVSSLVLNAIQHNTDTCTHNTKCQDDRSWFMALDALFTSRMRGEIDYSMLCDEIEFLVQDNTDITFVKQMNTLCPELNGDNRTLFLFFCNMLVSDNVQQITPSHYRGLFELTSEHISHSSALVNRSHKLHSLGLVQNTNSGGASIRDAFELTPMVVKDMLTEIEVDYDECDTKNIIRYTDIVEKSLFYNPAEAQQIDRLTKLLKEEQFAEIRTKLKDKGFRSGFACLFYGAPGTGKTETVLQLARTTGRNLIEVNVEEIKSKWVGESEKNIREIFKHYRSTVENSDVAPILFFNEADAIFGKRIENSVRSVDKMENSIQNIILEELENLDGIVIATTNLTCNLDKAFERRFIYKIEFTQPAVEAKMAIWRSMIPELTCEEASMLAERYNFSGGQIENIARKNVVDSIIGIEELSIESICRHCNAEVIGGAQRPIGF